MEKWKELNMPLRSSIIGAVLRLEQSTSSALISIMRIFKPSESKTLGNKSSALSFKSKVDLLFDLGEIDKTEYNHLIKLMEIRNQFAHNPNAISFEELGKDNPDINKHLLKYCPKDIENEQNTETKLIGIFNSLWKHGVGKILAIDLEYTQGIRKEIRKYVNDRAIENLDVIWEKALERNKSNKTVTPRPFFTDTSDSDIALFYGDFKIAMNEYIIKELEGLDEKGNSIFRQKEPIGETIARLKKGNESK